MILSTWAVRRTPYGGNLPMLRASKTQKDSRQAGRLFRFHHPPAEARFRTRPACCQEAGKLSLNLASEAGLMKRPKQPAKRLRYFGTGNIRPSHSCGLRSLVNIFHRTGDYPPRPLSFDKLFLREAITYIVSIVQLCLNSFGSFYIKECDIVTRSDGTSVLDSIVSFSLE